MNIIPGCYSVSGPTQTEPAHDVQSKCCKAKRSFSGQIARQCTTIF